MALIKVKSLKDFPYAGRMRKAGTEYEVRPEHLAFLEQTGMAKRIIEAPPIVKERKRRYKRRDMIAEQSVEIVETAAVVTEESNEDTGTRDHEGETADDDNEGRLES